MVLEWFLNFNYLSLNSACFKIVRKSVFVEKDIYFPDNYRYAEDLTICGGILSVAKISSCYSEKFVISMSMNQILFQQVIH